MEIVTAKGMRALEARAFTRSAPRFTFMRRAGEAVARVLSEHVSRSTLVCVLCGPGSNGGDGYIAAQRLAMRGYRVRVVALVAKQTREGDSGLARERYAGETLEASAFESLLADTHAEPRIAIIDAMFGIGLSRPLQGTALRLAKRCSIARATRRAFVLSVDVPSGLRSDSPAVPPEGAVEADVTVAFFRKKIAHCLLPARRYCGSVVQEGIDLPEQQLRAEDVAAYENSPQLWQSADFLAPLALDVHKYRRGQVVVVSSAMAGASRLAAYAAARSGLGAVRVLEPRESLARTPSSLISTPSLESALARGRSKTAILFGCGAEGGGDTLTRLQSLLQHSAQPIVLDAGALRAMGAGPTQRLFAALPPATILTPHRAEFEALFARWKDILQETDPLAQVRAAAAVSRAVVVLKGADTLIASPQGRVAITSAAPPSLASAGSGDVLAGAIAGLLAQSPRQPFLAACAATWMHSQAAKRAERKLGRAMIADDLLEPFAQLLDEQTSWRDSKPLR